MFMFAMSPCVCCGQVFSYNPDLVPSVRVSLQEGRLVPDPNGTREPFCPGCVERANVVRAEKGLPPIVVLPGAYDVSEVP